MMKNVNRWLRLVFIALAIILASHVTIEAGSAIIRNFWIESAISNGRKGLKMHVAFDVKYMRGVSTGVEIHFFDHNGNSWCASMDDGVNKKNVVIHRKQIVTPKYDQTSFNDVWFFVPYDNLQLKSGKYTYYCCAFVTDEHVSPNKILSKSSLSYFTIDYIPRGPIGYPGKSTYYSYNDPSGASNNNSSAASSKNNSSIGESLLALGALVAAGAGVVSALSGNSNSSSSSNNSAVTSVYSKSNVEIVDWWTLGPMAISHAKVQIRNKNNYDVMVNIDFYQNKRWYVGQIIYSDYERTDRLSGVSDEFKEDIKVPANSIRTVYLKTSGRGRPANIRLLSVY